MQNGTLILQQADYHRCCGKTSLDILYFVWAQSQYSQNAPKNKLHLNVNIAIILVNSSFILSLYFLVLS